MKTLEYLSDALVEIRRQKLRNEITQSTFKKQVTILSFCKLYVETNPSEEFVKSEIKRLKKLIKSIEDKFPEWKEGLDGRDYILLNPKKNPKTYWGSINQLPAKRKQVKQLEFLLA